MMLTFSLLFIFVSLCLLPLITHTLFFFILVCHFSLDSFLLLFLLTCESSMYAYIITLLIKISMHLHQTILDESILAPLEQLCSDTPL